jgi:hypothetical protein
VENKDGTKVQNISVPNKRGREIYSKRRAKNEPPLETWKRGNQRRNAVATIKWMKNAKPRMGMKEKCDLSQRTK